jgi:6-hydroxycyclohex-1-ene-1-carbonyl-CoA dehydrogenase
MAVGTARNVDKHSPAILLGQGRYANPVPAWSQRAFRDNCVVRITSWIVTAAGAPMVEQSRDESPRDGEVLIAVAACGVCHTDLSFYYEGVATRRPFPLTLGHEISGRVVAAGPGAETWIDRLVIVPSVLPCGTCAACAAGRGQVCPTQVFPGSSVHGGFGSHILVPARGLCAVPDLGDRARNPSALDLTALAVVADAVSTPYQAIVRSGTGPGTLAVWVGAGGLGSFGVQISAALGATVVAVDVDDERLARAGAYGAALALNSAGADARALRDDLRRFGAARGIPTWRTVIFETSGQPSGQRMAFGLIGHGTVLSVIGYTATSIDVRLSNLMAYDAIAQGNWGCLPEHYPAIVELALAGRVAIEPFIDRRPMSTINEVFAGLRAGAARKRIVLLADR